MHGPYQITSLPLSGPAPSFAKWGGQTIKCDLKGPFHCGPRLLPNAAATISGKWPLEKFSLTGKESILRKPGGLWTLVSLFSQINIWHSSERALLAQSVCASHLHFSEGSAASMLTQDFIYPFHISNVSLRWSFSNVVI